MTAGFSGSDLEAGDAAWRAWRRLGVNVWNHVFAEQPAPALFDELAARMNPELDRVTRLVLDELEVRLYGEARERVVASVQRGMVKHALWAVVTGIRRELTRPDPVPFVPPPVGAWVRSRYVASDRRPEVEWSGRWHLFSGDLVRVPAFRVNDVDGRTRCGVRLSLRSEIADHVAVLARPGVDACGRCARIAGA